MASAVVNQQTSSKAGKEDSKTLNKMNPDEKNQSDKGSLRNVSPTSDALVRLLEGVDGVVINQKVEVAETGIGMFAAWACFCCKVGSL